MFDEQIRHGRVYAYRMWRCEPTLCRPRCHFDQVEDLCSWYLSPIDHVRGVFVSCDTRFTGLTSFESCCAHLAFAVRCNLRVTGPSADLHPGSGSSACYQLAYTVIAHTCVFSHFVLRVCGLSAKRRIPY